MQYIIKNKDVYLVEVIWSKFEYNYTWSVGKTHYFETYKKESRLKVLHKMYPDRIKCRLIESGEIFYLTDMIIRKE